MSNKKGYIVNPKTKGSGIIAAIPQTGLCPNKCEDCFFQSGRSYLEPLDKNLPNMPPVELAKRRVVRVNDGNDSNVKRDLVVKATKKYPFRFFNTAIPWELEKFPGPVVLTLNPGKKTDNEFFILDPVPKNLMFVRVRTNTWNLPMVKKAVDYYTKRGVPVVLTFMAYFKTSSVAIPKGHKKDYVFRERTTNPYNAITTAAWRRVMKTFENNILVYSCGRIEGELGSTKCARCGNCLREYFVTLERLEG